MIGKGRRIDQIAPLYVSWADYLARTSYADRMKRCYAASKRANRVHRCLWRRTFEGRDLISRMMRDRIKGPCECCGNLPATECSGEVKITSHDVWALIEKAQGRCIYCGSLAVENRPSHPKTGGPLPWEHAGRRVGSLEHINDYPDGRINYLSNLGWACLWCNVHREARLPLSADHGGYYPPD
jgi:hypothetical protein